MNAAPLVDELRALPEHDREAILSSLSVYEGASLAYAWEEFWARKDQLIPDGDWSTALLVGGRGSGKSTSALHWFKKRAKAGKGPMRLIAGSDEDVRCTLVEEGLLSICSPEFMPKWEPSIGLGRLTWPNGVVARCYSAESPWRLRGKESQTDLLDDLAAWRTRAQETFDMAALGLRRGDARRVATTTPLDNDFVGGFIDNPLPGQITIVSESAFNRSNLPRNFFAELTARYSGTEFGEQELRGRLIRKSKNSPFHGLLFDRPPISGDVPKREDLAEIVISVDPTETAHSTSDEAGLMAMGRDRKRHVYVLEDRSGVYESEKWGSIAIEMAELWGADRFVVESNRGLALATAVLNSAYRAARLESGKFGRGALLPVEGVKAMDGKGIRAAPVRMLYITGQIHHAPNLLELEAQMRSWNPEAEKHKPRSDDRIDALVHGATYLADLNKEPTGRRARGGTPMLGLM